MRAPLTRARLVLASLVHHRRAHLGVLLGATVGAAVLVGALLVGDSVRHTLRSRALERIGRADAALVGGDRLFRARLADEIEGRVAGSVVAPVLRLDGVASAQGGARSANGVAVLGVDERFFALAPDGRGPAVPGPREVLLGERLAAQLEAGTGDTLVLRVAMPSALPRDMVLATTEDATLGLRVRVAGVVGAGAFGRFALEAGQVPPFDAFLSLAWLQEELGATDRANLLLAGGAAALDLDAALRESFEPEDAELTLRTLEGGGAELATTRIFLDEPVVRAAEVIEGEAPLGVLTYFVNGLAHGERVTPYSMVAALGPLRGAGRSPLPELAADEVVIGSWLADDLAAGPGDTLELRYFVPTEDRKLREDARAFRVRSVVPLEGVFGDPTLMPAFPGISDSEDCRDWEPGIPVDLEAIRDKDEAYWDEHRGTPKAFVSLAAGRAMWENRFGSLTAVRTERAGVDELRATLRAGLEPASIGLFFRDVRGPALEGSRAATDFGGLFLGLSFFLIASALLLTTLLFVLGVEQRSSEVGLFLALGFRPRDVRRQLFGEAAALAALGALLGTLLGTLYTRLVLRGLATVWSGAVASARIEYHASALTLAGGAVGAFVASLLAIAWALRRQARHAPLELLATTEGVAPEAPAALPRRARASLAAGVVLLLAALVLGLATDPGRGAAAAGAFFGAGALLLLAALALSRWALAWLGRAGRPTLASVGQLGRANAARRPGRSLATLTLLACGTFLVVSIGVNKKSGATQSGLRASGTGGFALVGRTTLPVHEDLNTARGREAYALSEDDAAGVHVVPLRVRDGDDASCLNLGVPQAPRLVGVPASELERLGAFAFTGGATGWSQLGEELAPDEVPGVADASSVRWTMHKAVGETLEYVDERGQPFRVRLVATLADSILQGNLLIDEDAFRARFPTESGYRMLLLDAPAERADEVSRVWTRALSDVGLELTPAARRLDEFNAVQNTYLAIFQVLGGLGVLLGCVGLGVVVLRNALERRRELAVVRALGFSRGALRRLLASEHVLLAALGLVGGAGAALLALLPVARAAGADASPRLALLLVAAIAVNALVWVWAAAAWASRGSLLAALRNE